MTMIKMDSAGRVSVAERLAFAQHRFSQLILTAQDVEAGSLPMPITAGDVQDLADRLHLWAGTIGASHPPRSALSLESRLVEVSEILEEILRLLGELAEVVEDCEYAVVAETTVSVALTLSSVFDQVHTIISGERESCKLVVYTGIELEDGEGDDSDFSVVSSEDSDVETKDEAQDLLGIASDCVSGLLRITTLIKKATPRDRFTKSLRDQRDAFLDEFDINHVQERYPKLARPESRWLCERLGRTITQRRRFLRYCREHRDRLGRSKIKAAPSVATANMPGLKGHLGSPRHVTFNVPPPPIAKMSTEGAADGIGPSYEASAAPTIPSTKASTLDRARLHAAMQQQQSFDLDALDNVTVYSSAASSSAAAALDQEDARLQLPSLGVINGGKLEFECLLCHDVVKISRERSWRRHALRDLKAYVCTMGEGECGLEYFGSQDAWFEHEVQKHRRQWTCALCGQGSFVSGNSFKLHTAALHGELEAAQFPVLESASRMPLQPIPAQDCPFCDDWQMKLRESLADDRQSNTILTVEPRRFRRHVGAHLQQLAIFAIPRGMLEADEDVGESIDAGNRSSDSRQDAWSWSGDLSFKTVSQDDPDASDKEGGSQTHAGVTEALSQPLAQGPPPHLGSGAESFFFSGTNTLATCIRLDDGTNREKLITPTGEFYEHGKLIGHGKWKAQSKFIVEGVGWNSDKPGWWVGSLAVGGMYTNFLGTEEETDAIEPTNFEKFSVPSPDAPKASIALAERNKEITPYGEFFVNGALLGHGQWKPEGRFTVHVKSWGSIWWVGVLVTGGMNTATFKTAKKAAVGVPTHFEAFGGSAGELAAI